MIFDLPFDVIFCGEDDKIQRLDNWKTGKSAAGSYYTAAMNDVQVSVIVSARDGLYIRIHNCGTAAVRGFWGVQFAWRMAEECYTLIPGIYYNGNDQPNLFPIPAIHLPDNPRFEASLSAASYPAVLIKDGTAGISLELSPMSCAGWNGIALDAQEETLTIYAPARESRIYRHKGFETYGRPPYVLEPRSIITLHMVQTCFSCDGITGLFEHFWNHTIRSPRYPAHNAPKLPEAKGAALVRDWLYEKHCVFSRSGAPLLLNAFTDLEGTWPYTDEYAEWKTMIGWCDGPMTALPLLKYGGKYRDFAIQLLDFLSENGQSPSGVKYPVFDGERWMTKDHPQAGWRNYDHIRFYADYIYYLGRSIRYEQEQNIAHENWERDFAHGIRTLVDVWKREKDFGIYWDLEGSTPHVYGKGTGAGAFAVLALAEGVRHFGQDAELKAAFVEACTVYYERCVKTGRCNGGPADILEADDSESIAALTDALVQQYQLLGGSERLQMALDAARLFASWVVNYVPDFPRGSMFEHLNVCGGVLANVQNRHVGPGICTNSARFLYDLGTLTGDDRWKELYWRIKAAAINCITSYDGEFFDLEPNAPFYQGMLSEQINVTDALGLPGETWRVSACWPATAVLLGWFDTPC